MMVNDGKYLVGGFPGTWLDYFSIHIGDNHPNWRNHIFQRGGSTTNQVFISLLRKIWSIPFDRSFLSIFRASRGEFFDPRNWCWGMKNPSMNPPALYTLIWFDLVPIPFSVFPIFENEQRHFVGCTSPWTLRSFVWTPHLLMKSAILITSTHAKSIITSAGWITVLLEKSINRFQNCGGISNSWAFASVASMPGSWEESRARLASRPLVAVFFFWIRIQNPGANILNLWNIHNIIYKHHVLYASIYLEMCMYKVYVCIYIYIYVSCACRV